MADITVPCGERMSMTRFVTHIPRCVRCAAWYAQSQRRRPPYPEFCRDASACSGLSQCPRDPTCAD